ncbi:hypothetical protein [Shigella phage ESh6]|nr:hypothetical protein [Shigella phage ESh6]
MGTHRLVETSVHWSLPFALYSLVVIKVFLTD